MSFVEPKTVFTIINTAVTPFWLLLLVAPSWRWTQRLVHSLVVPVVLGLAYLLLLSTSPSPSAGAPGGFGLDGMMAALQVPQTFVAGWAHYLVFDLFVGAWMVRDARRRGVRHLWVVPCALGAFMLGPLGLLAYAFLRAVKGEGFSLDEAAHPEPVNATPGTA